MINGNFLNQISPFQNNDRRSLEKSRPSLNLKKNTHIVESPYMLEQPKNKDNIAKKRFSINFKENFSIEKELKKEGSKKKFQMKDFVHQILSDEDFVKKNYPTFKIERILKPGETYGEAGLEFKTKKLLKHTIKEF